MEMELAIHCDRPDSIFHVFCQRARSLQLQIGHLMGEQD